MADPLADVLNRISANPQDASAPPAPSPQQDVPWVVKLNNALGGIMSVFNPLDRLTSRNIADGTANQDARDQFGQLARIPTDVVEGAVGLPNLPSTLSTVLGGPDIPRIGGLDEVVEKVHKVGQDIGSAIAGRELGDSLLTGSPSDVRNNWTRLLAGAAMPVPGSWQASLSKSLNKVTAGSEVANNIASKAGTILEVLTPLSLNPKTAGVGVGAAATIAPALEFAAGTHAQAVAGNQQSHDQAKGALDVAAQGIEEAKQHLGIPVQAGFSTGDTVTDVAILGGVSLAAAAALTGGRFNLNGRVLNNIKSAVTGYNPKAPLDATEMGLGDLLRQQWGRRTQTPEVAVENLWKSINMPKIDDRVTEMKELNSRRQGASVDTRLQSVYTDGTLPDSKVKVGALQDWHSLAGELSTDQAQLLDRALISTPEVYIREGMLGKHYLNPVASAPYNLPTVPTSDLKALIKQAQADPQVAPLYNEYLRVNRQLLAPGGYTEEQVRFSRREIQDFAKTYPNFVAHNITADRWLSPPDIRPNMGFKTFEEMGSPTQLWPSFIDEVVRSTEGGKIKRDFFNEFTRWAGRSNAVASDLIGRTVFRSPPKDVEGMYVHWRDARGESRWTEVRDAAVRNSLQDVTNPSSLQLNKGLWDTLTRTYEAGAVGVPAAVTGNVFAPASVWYARTIGSALRPPGVAFTPLDKLVQKTTKAMTGKAVGVPGDIVTSIPQDAFNAAMNVLAVLSQRGGQALHNSMLTGGFASSLMGPATARAAADGMKAFYDKSALANFRQHGNLGPASFMSVDPSASFRTADSVLRGGIPKETLRFVGDILHAITSAPGVTTMQLNKGMDKNILANAIRNMSGDPGQSGAFRGASALASGTNTIPWGNVFLQSGFRVFDAFKQHPVSAVAGIANASMFTEMAAAMWNVSQGKEYADYMYNDRPTDRAAAHIYIAIPGMKPEQGLEIPVDPWLRPFKGIATITAGTMLGIMDGSLWRAENDPQRQAIADSIKHKYFGSPFRQGTLANSVLNQTFMPPLPGYIEALNAAQGFPTRGIGDMRERSDKHMSGFTEGTGRNGQSFLNHFSVGWLEDVMRGVGAQFGANITQMLDDTLSRRFSEQLGHNEPNQSTLDAAREGFLGNAKQNLIGSGKSLGAPALFDGALTISPYNETAGLEVKSKLDGLQKLAQAFSSSTTPGGAPQIGAGSRKTGSQELLGIAPAQPQDQTMQWLGQEANRIHTQLSAPYLANIKQIEEQITSVRGSNQYSPSSKRAMINEMSNAIIVWNRRTLQEITRQEGVISNQLGVPFKFDGVNLNRGADQFK